MRGPQLTLGSIAVIAVAIFSMQNAELLTVNFLFWSFEIRRAILLFLVLFTGVGIGWILHGWPRRRRGAGKRPPDSPDSPAPGD